MTVHLDSMICYASTDRNRLGPAKGIMHVINSERIPLVGVPM